MSAIFLALQAFLLSSEHTKTQFQLLLPHLFHTFQTKPLSTNVTTVEYLNVGQNQFGGIHMAMKCLHVYYCVPMFFHRLYIRLVNLSSMKTLTKRHTPHKYTFMWTYMARTVDSLIFKGTHTQSYGLTIFQNHLASWNKEIDIKDRLHQITISY
jgi:hypothetical protein